MQSAGLVRDFHRGKHSLVLDKFYGKKWKEKKEDLVPVIGSLSFLGRMQEAEALFHQKKKSVSDLEKAACRFYLGVGFSRQSSYEKGKGFFLENLKEFKKHPDPHIQFYLYQGVGFFRYLQCRYFPASRWGMRALLASNQSRFTYGRCFASDLLGYTKVLSGQISEGLNYLETSRTLAKDLGTGSWQEAAEVAILCYEAQFGMKPKTILKELDGILNRLSEDLSYLRSSVLLEKARQLTLRGKLSESNETLNEAFRLVYASKHKRHGVLLSLRLAENKYLEKDFFGAFNLIRNLKSELDPEIDQQLTVGILGMEKKLCAKLHLPFDEKELEKLTLKSGTGLAKRLLKREKGVFRSSGEDRLGDWIENALDPKVHLDEIIESGYLGILFPRLPSYTTKNVVFEGFSQKWILILENGNLKAIKKNHASQIHQLLLILSKGEISKEKLVQSLWNYSYHPLRHDSLLYRSIGRLRDYLGMKTPTIEATATGYRFHPEISITFVNPVPKAIEPISSAPSPIYPVDSELNHRQAKLLQILEKKDFLSVAQVQKLFKTSLITASRDLSQLHRLGKLRRVGRARATHYCLANVSDRVK